jgi:serine/threonine protein kinase
MPSLQTPQEFVSAVRNRRLVDAAQLKGFVAAVRGQPALTARRLADRAVAAGLLTRFQADELIAGRGEGLLLGDYRLLDRLGEGWSGGVFLAEHAPSGERRAVKVLHADHADDPVAGRRLSREAAAAADLDHPNLVRVIEYDPGCTDRPPFLVMEYVDGVNLQAAVALAGTFTAEAAAECGRQAALGLHHAWDAGLVHRDVKPANLLVSRGGRVKVLDFGLVRLKRGGGLTATNNRQLLGTAAYVAPEQITNGSEVDCRADVYALGGTLYFLLAGHPPFDQTAVVNRLQGKPHTEPPAVHTLRPDVPEGLSAVIAAMLSYSPDRRPPTPAAAALQLTRWARPKFADDLFARIGRNDPDTLPEVAPVTPGPVRPTDLVRKPSDSTTELVGPQLPETDPEATTRIGRPFLSRDWGWRVWGLAAVAVGVIIVLLLLIVFFLTR